MTGVVVHQCPKCELRFSFRTELEQHLREDHPEPIGALQTPVAEVAEAVDPAPSPPVPPAASGSAARRRAAQSWVRIAGLLLAIAGVLLVAYAGVFVSIASAAIVAGVLLLAGVICVWRLRAQAREPRR